MATNNKSQSNFLNYKIVKCKNWEKDRTCKYGAHCTFAHGDEDLRNKADNLYQMNTNIQMMVPMMIPQGMDMRQMEQIMLGNQLMMGMGMNPNMVNQETIAQMKKGVVIVNTSRGALIDAEALLEGIKARKIGAACLDVYEENDK